MAGDDDRRGERLKSGRRDPARNTRRDPLTIDASAQDVTVPESAIGSETPADVVGAGEPSPTDAGKDEAVFPEPAARAESAAFTPPEHPNEPAPEPQSMFAAEDSRTDVAEGAAERRRSNFATAIAVAVVVMAGAIIYLFYQLTSLGPDRSGEIASLTSRVAALEARPAPDTAGVAKQAAAAQESAAQAHTELAQAHTELAALTKRVDGWTPPPAAPNVQPQIADLQGSLADVRKSLTALQATVTALPRPDVNRIEARFGDIDGRLAGLQAAVSGIPHIDLGPLTGKVDALEGRIKPLEADVQAAQSPERVAERKAAPLAVTAQAVVAAIAAGQAFPQEFRALQVLGVDPAKLAPLQTVAANGAPSLRDLQDDLAQARDRIVAQGTPAPSGSYMDRIMSGATSLVQVRPLGSVVGDSPSAIVARMNDEIGTDDLAAALADWQKLPEASRNASKSLPERIKLRLDAETAARDIATSAVGTMAAPRG